jgi:hypothetical protein
MFTSRRKGTLAVVTLVLLVPLGGCGRGTRSPAANPAPSPSASSTATTPGPASPAAPPTRTTPAPPVRSHVPSAADQLDGFFTAAQRADGQIRAAAALFNEGVTPKGITVQAKASSALRAIDLTPVGRAIPGGLPAALQYKALYVYSELSARLGAFNPISRESQPGHFIPAGSDEYRFVMRALSGGATPAANFAGDLAALRSLAGSTGPVHLAAANSHATAEVALQVLLIGMENNGCASSGGRVYTKAVPIVWGSKTTDGAGHTSDGTIAGIPFQADYQQGQGWHVVIWAC